jgi:O-antigen ligase
VRALLLAAAFFSAYQLIRVSAQNITLSDVALLTAFVLLAARGAVTGTPFGLFTPMWFGAVGLMLGGLFLSSLLYGDLFRWMIIAVQYMVAYLLLPMVIMSQPRGFIKRLLVAFVVGVAALEASGILASFVMSSNDATDLFGTGFLAGNGRMGSFVGEANWNGAMIAFAMSLLIYAIHERLVPLLVGVLLAITLLWGLLMSASFTGFTATTLSALVTLAVAGRRYLVRIALPAMLLIGGFAFSGLPLPTVFEQRVGDALLSGDIQEAGTYTGRVGLIGEAWGMVENTSLLGVGADEFRHYSSDHQPVHDLYLLVWVEGGIVALVGLIAMLAMLVLLALGRTARRPETALALSAVTVFLIYTAASPHMFARLWVLPLMLALGTLYGRDDDYPAGYCTPSFWAAA